MILDNETTLPLVPKEGQMDVNQYLFDNTKDYEEPRYLLEYKGVPFSPLGGIQAMTGQKKNGKTFVLAEFMAAILGSGSERMRAMLPDLKIVDSTREFLGHEPSVLYVDTEMEHANSAKVVRRVRWLCNADLRSNAPNFRQLWLRTTDRTLRRQIIHDTIDQMRPDCVFVDGVRDVIGDFNNIEESVSLIDDLMKIATEFNCCIWNVLHYNPRLSAEGEDGKMRGHLGTELGNKVSDTFACVKKKSAEGVTFTVKQQDARGKDVEDWNFVITDDAGMLGIPRIINETNRPTAEHILATDGEVKEWFENGQGSIIWPATAVDIRKLIKEYGNVGKHEKQKAYFEFAISNKFIIPQDKSEFEKGQNYPKYKLNEDISCAF